MSILVGPNCYLFGRKIILILKLYLGVEGPSKNK